MIIWAARAGRACQSAASASTRAARSPPAHFPRSRGTLAPSQPPSAFSSPPRPTSPFLLSSPRPQASFSPGVPLAHRECTSFSSLACPPIVRTPSFLLYSYLHSSLTFVPVALRPGLPPATSLTFPACATARVRSTASRARRRRRCHSLLVSP